MCVALMVTTPHKRKKDYLFGYSFRLDGLDHDDGLAKNPNYHIATE